MEILDFGQTHDGRTSSLYILSRNNIKIAVTDYGASLVNIFVPDKKDIPTDIVLGYDDVSGYENDPGAFIGCNIGRCANRIGNAEFTINDITYKLEKNCRQHNLHSGMSPYSKRFYTVTDSSDTSITFSLKSPDLDQGFPGNLSLNITYSLFDDGFKIIYDAICDKDTIINITNHSYFNLNGAGNGRIHDHIVKINADSYTPYGNSDTPSGEISSVLDTPMDFTVAKPIDKDIKCRYEQLKLGSGYDHNYCINNYDGTTKNVVYVHSPKSGITMNISTNYPGLQFYTGNYLFGMKGKNRTRYRGRYGVCFEPQFYPDAIHHNNFISPVHKANQPFSKEIIYTFS